MSKNGHARTEKQNWQIDYVKLVTGLAVFILTLRFHYLTIQT